MSKVGGMHINFCTYCISYVCGQIILVCMYLYKRLSTVRPSNHKYIIHTVRFIYHSVSGMHPLPDKHSHTTFQEVNVAACIQMYVIYILDKRPCGAEIMSNV